MSALKDITDIRFGRLVAVGVARRSGGKVLWKCVCDCGNSIDVQSAHLRSGHTQTCGCTRVERMRSDNPASSRILSESTPHRILLSRYRRGAQERGLEFDLSEEDVRALVSSCCSYCLRPPSQVMKLKRWNFVHTGIDRVDNDIGYVRGNCVACCRFCNRAKNDMSMESFKGMVISLFNNINSWPDRKP